MSVGFCALLIQIFGLVQSSLSCPKPDNGGIHYLMVGNPGTGKSTLLNGFVGKPLFESGLSFGSGLTYELDVKKSGKDVFMDTPGLADEEMRVQAAQAITQAMRKGGLFKVFFVITLESGRVRPQDKTTMKLVLQAAPQITNYAVIINKLSNVAMDMLYTNQRNAATRVFASIMSDLPTQTVHFKLLPRDEMLVDQSNVVPVLDDATWQFLESAPVVVLTADRVDDVKADEFDQQLAAIESKLTIMQTQNEVLQAELVQQSANHAQMVRDLQQRANQQADEYRRQISNLQGSMLQDSMQGK